MQLRDGRIVRTTDPNGVQAVATYDPFGRVTRIDHSATCQLSMPRRRNVPGRLVAALLIPTAIARNDAVGQEASNTMPVKCGSRRQEGSPTRAEWRDSLIGPSSKLNALDGTFIASSTDYDLSGRWRNRYAILRRSGQSRSRRTSRLELRRAESADDETRTGQRIDPSRTATYEPTTLYQGRQTMITVHAAQWSRRADRPSG